ncbi:MAG: GNAT family N-acetyltransferase [Verrucomicrobiae bacterium]|nr:GNAT family N-acetyltransferase [Verrucomicrobiae bacterium]
MEPADWPEVSDLIYLSTNTWYEINRGHPIFSGGPQVCELFCRVYHQLEPGCGIVAQHRKTGRIAGSCFFHPRETHVSLGIMNVHPNHFGEGIASALLKTIMDFAKRYQLPLRLVSSALNLDSFSLYTRHGFVPYALYQDLAIEVPRSGLNLKKLGLSTKRVREADLEDISAIGALEFEVSGISRERDYCYFIENDDGIWKTLVIDSQTKGEIDGFLVSVNDPAARLIGPGVSRDPDTAFELVVAHLDRFHGQTPVVLAPSDQPELITQLYQLGARNCELHVAQILGEKQPINGIVMPTFMPESG